LATYFAFTTLSTVGFGDYNPRSNLERCVGIFLLVFGTMIFSDMAGQFLDMIHLTENFMMDQEDTENAQLSKFYQVIYHLNE